MGRLFGRMETCFVNGDRFVLVVFIIGFSSVVSLHSNLKVYLG